MLVQSNTIISTLDMCVVLNERSIVSVTVSSSDPTECILSASGKYSV